MKEYSFVQSRFEMSVWTHYYLFHSDIDQNWLNWGREFLRIIHDSLLSLDIFFRYFLND